MDIRNRNVFGKRIFGKDLTNLEKRGKNLSISEKTGSCQNL